MAPSPDAQPRAKRGFCCFPENKEQSQVLEPVAQTYSNRESLFKRNLKMTRISKMHPGCLPAVTSLSHPQPKSSGNQEGRTRLTWTPLGDPFPIPAEDGPGRKPGSVLSGPPGSPVAAGRVPGAGVEWRVAGRAARALPCVLSAHSSLLPGSRASSLTVPAPPGAFHTQTHLHHLEASPCTGRRAREGGGGRRGLPTAPRAWL